MLCLTGFSREDLLKNHKKYCNGLKGKLTRIDMPKEEEKIVSFLNYYKQMKAPYVIYADFEALVKKISLCEQLGQRVRKKLHHENRISQGKWLFLHGCEK